MTYPRINLQTISVNLGRDVCCLTSIVNDDDSDDQQYNTDIFVYPLFLQILQHWCLHENNGLRILLITLLLLVVVVLVQQAKPGHQNNSIDRSIKIMVFTLYKTRPADLWAFWCGIIGQQLFSVSGLSCQDSPVERSTFLLTHQHVGDTYY